MICTEQTTHQHPVRLCKPFTAYSYIITVTIHKHKIIFISIATCAGNAASKMRAVSHRRGGFKYYTLTLGDLHNQCMKRYCFRINLHQLRRRVSSDFAFEKNILIKIAPGKQK